MENERSFSEYIEQKRSAVSVTANITERWNARIAPQNLPEMGKSGATNYLTRYGKNISEEKVVKLALKAEAEGFQKMADGFWEYAYSLAAKEGQGQHAAAHRHQPIKILFLASNPQDTSRLRLDQEIRAIDLSLQLSKFRDKFVLAQQWAIQVTELQGYLLRHNPDIVHFSGHGSQSGEIILENEQGHSQLVSTRALESLFAILGENVKCVVLNACYSEQQAQAIARHVRCVVGMSRAISDEAALSFSTAFYQALGYGKDLKTAFSLGNLQIDLENLQEAAVPKLICLKHDPANIFL